MDEYGNTWSVKNPVPWNLELAMYIVADNQEDALQIVEQILPQFNPDMTIAFKSVLGVTTNVPISLNSVGVQDDYEGSMTEDRLVVYTLTFVAKMELYGEVIYHGQLKPPVIDDGLDDGSSAGDEDDNQDNAGGAHITINVGTSQTPNSYIKSPGVYLKSKTIS